jgi:hypothetical protein
MRPLTRTTARCAGAAVLAAALTVAAAPAGPAAQERERQQLPPPHHAQEPDWGDCALGPDDEEGRELDAAGIRTPWHQDQPYYNVDGQQNCSMWLPVDPVGRESTLEFVAGSHRGPWLMPRTFMDSQAKWFPEGTLQELPDIDGDLAREDGLLERSRADPVPGRGNPRLVANGGANACL